MGRNHVHDAAAGQKNEGELYDQQKLLHIFVVPFQLDGHVNCMLKLARALAAQHNVLVTFACPARYHALAQKRNHEALSAAQLQLMTTHPNSADEDASVTMMLRVEVLDDGLPCEEGQGLTPDVVLASVPMFQSAVKLLLDDLVTRSGSAHWPPPCCIVSDTFTPWTHDLAKAVGLPLVDFWTGPAAGYSMGSQLARLVSDGTISLPMPRSRCWAESKCKWIKADAPLIDCIPGLPPIPPTDFLVDFAESEDISTSMLHFMLAAFGHTRDAHTILVHSAYELESQVLDALQANGLPIYAVGPLLHSPSELLPTPENGVDGMAAANSLHWLDTQRPASVIYVALGTLAKLSPSETHSLALGLEASGHPFLWVMRRDSIAGSVSATLPRGFLQRTVEKGLGLIVPWAPQAEVLQHHAIGAFFSPCGWNSTLDCMWEGIPMVACPLAGDQRSNARWIVENGKFGVELERQGDGSFTKEAVQRALKEVLGLEEGKGGVSFKERALEMRKVARAAVQKGGSSHSNLVGFLHRLRLRVSGDS